MLDRNIPIDTGLEPGDLAPDGTTPTLDAVPRRMSDFATLGEALDYAASGRRGMNFHDARGRLVRSYPYAELASDALGHARVAGERRMLGAGEFEAAQAERQHGGARSQRHGGQKECFVHGFEVGQDLPVYNSFLTAR